MPYVADPRFRQSERRGDHPGLALKGASPKFLDSIRVSADTNLAANRVWFTAYKTGIGYLSEGDAE